MKTVKLIFISHCAEDSRLANWLSKKLRKDGFNAWVYNENINPGDNFVDSINTALGICTTFLLIWSNDANKSDWVKKEWTSILAMNKDIIPLLRDKTQLPPILQGLEYIEFKTKEDGYKTLVNFLSAHTSEFNRIMVNY